MSTRPVAVVREEPAPLIESMAECSGFALNPYRDCDLRCVYCITGSQGTSIPRIGDDELLPRLRHELAALPPGAPIAVGALVDAYPLVEAELGVTRRLLGELARQRRPYNVITKGATVLRDIDLFQATPATVTVSLCTVDDEQLRRVDPKAPGVEERLGMIRALHDAGVLAEVSATPWIPDVSDAGALLERVGPGIKVRFAPLNVVKPKVAATPYGRRFEQQAINDAYLRERERVGPRKGVVWQFPVALDADEPRAHPFAGMPPDPLCRAG